MSSHHIVRDEQEPALLVLDTAAISKTHLWQLLEWSPVVMANDASAQQLISWGHKIDYWLSKHKKAGMNLECEVIQLTGAQTALTEAVDLLHNRNHWAVNIIGNPEALPVFALPQLQNLQLVLFEGGQRIAKTRAGRFKKWLPMRTELHVQPLSEGTFLSSEGFQQDLDNVLLTDEMGLTVAADQLVTITSNLKPFLVAEPI